MASAFLNALATLTKPIGEAHVSATHSAALLAALNSNLAELEERLRVDPGLQEVGVLCQQVRQEAEWYRDTEDITWRFVQECLLLMVTLTRHLRHLLESFCQDRAPLHSRTPEAAPPLPPDVLSVAQQRTVGAALQFVVTLGLCPYLSPGVGVALERRSAFGATVIEAVSRTVAPPPDRRLLVTILALLELSETSSLGTLLLTRHMGDIMAGLCQLGYHPRRPEGDTSEANKGVTMEERLACRKALQNLLQKVYQPIVIKELLILQGGPKQAQSAVPGGGVPRTALAPAPPWLRRLCGQLLSERLMQPKGVQAVVRAILEGAGAGPAGGAGADAAASDWRKCDAVARVLAACPQQSISAESYYSQVCPQVLELLHFRDKLTALQFQRVATSAALTMVQEQPELAHRYLLTPLLSPLVCCGGSSAGRPASVEEEELTRCVEDVYKICVVGNRPDPALLTSLGEGIPVLFSLYCFTLQNVSHLRAPCQEILLWYLSHLKPPHALGCLRRLSGLSGPGVLAPGFEFTPGSEGGAKLTQKATDSDEDDALYEKVSGEQWSVDCLVQLLGELKDSDLPGDFFLEMLKDLTSWAGEEEEADDECGGTSAVTLTELERLLWGRAETRAQKLVLLQVLAAMCQGVPHILLLRKPAQVLRFVEAVLQRACSGLTPGSMGTVENQTLSMAMGLVATMLTGAVMLGASDLALASCLLRPLELICQRHADPVIRELASDLQVALATRGAFCPDTVTQAARRHGPQAGTDTAASQNSRSEAATEKCDSQRDPCVTSDPDGCARPGHRAPAAPDSGSLSDQPNSSGPRVPLSSQTFSECLLEACDPDIPTRASALRTLVRATRDRDPMVLRFQEKVLVLFLENLEHEDSFVYLSAIQGLAELADAFPDRILQKLLEEYRSGPHPGPSTGPPRSLETRLKVGEVLMRASRALGDLAPHHGQPLIGAFLQGTRDADSTVRTSSLSNLGELCQRLHFSLGPLAQELSSCLTALIKTEKESEVRRAAVHVIAVLLRGLSEKTTQVLGDVLLDLYRALKWVVRADPDDVAVLHARLALEELDHVMRRFVFPEQKLEKKIVVLP
ncbi:transport and Golgi organization protein 6 homolog [Brienomyrus brachyistius]|uniref:transport and Golgi organization protein 6 homolog n=1 Tax=Brienomyrus brachyistius TaxID=42636 RepID=UPI0020B2E924|nr:transport and Golgi organization protein 6 homolog [Brienomyrus brachyistius]